jgi:hypothetical protein
MRRRWLLIGSLAACLSLGQAQNIFQKAPPGLEEALTARIHKFYTLWQAGKFREGEALVAEESRELYYSMQKVPIRKYELQNIAWSDDFKTAKVLIAFQDMNPRTAAYEIMAPSLGTWKEVGGQWFLVIDVPTTTPFGPMTFADYRVKQPSKPTETGPRPTVETLTMGALRISPQEISIPMDGQRTERTVTLTNNLPGPLMIEILDPKRPGLELKLSATQLGAKAQATLQVTYDPQKGKLRGPLSVPVLVQPLAQRFTVELLFQ